MPEVRQAPKHNLKEQKMTDEKLDVTNAIQPKSDQLNADSLLTGPRTIKIRDVKISDSEQPIAIFFDGDSGKPWKPCKTAARCLATIWGSDARKWIGQSCTIFNDPTVTWAGAVCGGIRVSHMDGLNAPRKLQLTKTRGVKGGVTIKPLEMGGSAPDPVDVAAAQNDARDSALGGKEGFTAWWKANPEKREAIASIMPAIKAIAAAADSAALDAGQIDAGDDTGAPGGADQAAGDDDDDAVTDDDDGGEELPL
tara:strand:- start:3222 stop:3980 length:759 start_codon:yes stop_codon:yes gene_type:complete